MSDLPATSPDSLTSRLPPQARGVAPTNSFVEFKKEETERSIPERFEQQVRRYPDRLAVSSLRHQLTYEAFNRAANRLARAILARRGEGQEPIALLFDHDAPLLIAMLAVLKAGKIYVPLDPSYPRARTAYMLEDAGAVLVVTENRMLGLASEMASEASQLLNVDELESGFSDENLGLALSPDGFTYIFYTSGSTGRPKGVVENHRNVLHFTMVNTNLLHLCPDDRFALLQSCSFSGTATPIFGALLNGAAIHPLNVKEDGLDGLTDWLIREGISFFHGGSIFRQWIETLIGKEEFPRLRLIYYGGETLHKRHVELFKQHFGPGCILVNGLGATEMKTFRKLLIDKQTEIPGPFVPVGYALEDTEVLLLDEAGEPVGFDCVGEIAVKSRYIAPAYWRRPELTAATFRPAPEGEGVRIYRTGDLGRMSPGGCLIHLGRRDFQVKIRGYRIEPGEIEAALLELGGIREAVVVARADRPGESRLVAYVVPGPGPVPMVSALRSGLQAKLPEYMLPATFVLLEALPRTPNGKLDRQALPEPGRGRPELEQDFVAPRTPLERRLAAIWAELLRLERVGVEDKFPALGGDSLIATRIVSRIRESLKIELPLRSLFDAPTVAAQAAVVLELPVRQDLVTRKAGYPELSERPSDCRDSPYLSLSEDPENQKLPGAC